MPRLPWILILFLGLTTEIGCGCGGGGAGISSGVFPHRKISDTQGPTGAHRGRGTGGLPERTLRGGKP